MDTPPKELLPYFDASDAGGYWNLWCKKCRRGWMLNKGNAHAGNILTLLDHAIGHDKPESETE